MENFISRNEKVCWNGLEQEIVAMSIDTEILHQGDPVVDGQDEVRISVLDNVF